MVTVNGALPAGLRADIGGGHELELGAALSWGALCDDVHNRYGWTPQPSPGASCYRPLADQVALFTARYQRTRVAYGQDSAGRALYDARTWNGVTYWRKRGQAAAAVPGTSNHGKGEAVDVADLGGFDGTRYRQFEDVATEHAWTNTEGRSIGEAWHWVKTGADPHTGITPKPPATTVPDLPPLPDPIAEDDMILLFKATGPTAGLITSGNYYSQDVGTGIVRPLCLPEVQAIRYANPQIVTVEWACIDLHNLGLRTGIYAQAAPIGATDPLGLTGYLIGRNADANNKSGTWSTPTRP